MNNTINIYGQLPSFISPKNLNKTIELAKLAEHYNYSGVLIYFNNRTIDPFILTSYLLQNTNQLIPLIACQPYYISPFNMARMVESFSIIYKRNIQLNMIIGASDSELNQIGEKLNHDQRYDRVVEFIELTRKILTDKEPITYNGFFYKTKRYEPLNLNQELLPKFFVAGSSPKSMAVCHHADVAITHPEPYSLAKHHPFYSNSENELAIRIGIITRKNKEEAWRIAKSRYQVSRKDLINTKMKLHSQSNWNKILAELALNNEIYDELYWLGPFICGSPTPVLVGDYETVAQYLSNYLKMGVKTILINSNEIIDFSHNDLVFKMLKG